jgi:hypothetical protein
MIYEKLGQRGRARIWFGESVAWMESHAPKDPTLRRAREEARVSLGIPEEDAE